MVSSLSIPTLWFPLLWSSPVSGLFFSPLPFVIEEMPWPWVFLPKVRAQRAFTRSHFIPTSTSAAWDLRKIYLATPSLHKIASPWSHSWGKSKSKIMRNQQNFTILLSWLVNKNSDDLQLAWVPPAVRSALCFQSVWLPGWPTNDMLHHCYNSQIRTFFMYALYLFKHMSIHNIR